MEDKRLVSEWESLIKNAEGQAEIHTLHKYVPDSIQSFEPAVPAQISPSERVSIPRDHRILLCFSDAQIDYRRLEDGTLEPLHDERAMSIVRQIAHDLQPDEIINLGDTVDLSVLSRFAPDSDHFHRTLGPSFQRAHDFYAELRADNPDAKIIEVDSNHNTRLRKFIGKYAMMLANVKQPNSDSIYPVLSYPFLTNLEHLGVEWISGYGAAEYVYGTEYGKPPIVFKHGEVSVSQGSTAAKESRLNPETHVVRGHCFDEKTEILTSKGWAKYTNLTNSTKVATLSKGGYLEFQYVKEIYEYDNYKELIHIDSLLVSLAVTPDHGLVARWNAKLPWMYKTAKEFYEKRSRLEFLRGAPTQEAGLNIDDCKIQLLAWILAEGSLRLTPTGSVSSIRIAQSDAPGGRLQKLEDCIEKCGLRYTKIKRYDANTKRHGQHRNFDAYRFNIHNSSQWFYEWFGDLADEHKNLLPSIMRMNVKQIKLFFETWIVADGSINKSAKRSSQIASNNLNHIDYLQALASMAAWRATSVAAKNQRRGRQLYYLTVNTNPISIVEGSSWSVRPYSGKVWCVAVDNGTLLVRREGKATFTQNSHRIETAYRTNRAGQYLASVVCGTLCRTDGVVPSVHSSVDDLNRPNHYQENWSQGVVVIEDYGGDYVFNHIPINNGRACFGGREYGA